jgi:alkylhydroperoxidase family enzyme
MKARLNPYRAAPEAMKALAAVQDYVQQSGHLSLAWSTSSGRAPRRSMAAPIAFICTRGTRARGESEERLYLLNAWRDSPLYMDRERAALAWTEALTLVAETHVPDQVYEEVRQHFAEDELVKLTLVVAMINAWNRVAISFRSVHPVKPATAAE